MPTRKPRPARSLPTCCDTSTSCDVAHVDAICAPPVPDACPDCGMTADDHEGRRLGYPWCMVHAVFASRFERLTSRGTWAYRYDRIVRDAVNGRAYTYSTAGVTAAELADRINATHPGGIVARASDAGRITLTAC